MSQHITPSCPRCGNPSFDGAVCWNNDCNYPALESRNARNRREAAEIADKARQRRDAKAQTKATRTKAARTGASSSGRWERIGGVLSLAGAIGGVWVGAKAMPDAPLAWVLAAVIGGCLAYALRKLIVYGGIAAAAAAVWVGSGPETGSPATTATAIPALPVPQRTQLFVDALCLQNDTDDRLELAFSAAQRQPHRFVLNPNDRHVLWIDPTSDPEPVETALIEVTGHGSANFEMGRQTIGSGDTNSVADRIDCPSSRVPGYRLFWSDTGGLSFRRMR